MKLMSDSTAEPALDVSPHLAPVVYLTDAVAAVGGRLKDRPEDFIVEEIPAYEPSGTGEHLYLFIQKVNLSTTEMVDILARHFGVPQHAIGYAGLKDKKAITRQVVSIHAPGRKFEEFPSLRHELLSVMWADMHTNKLRRGHLKGNRFAIKLRGVPLRAAMDAQKALRMLERTGVPNRAGEQRFGLLHNNHLVGRALVLGRFDEALREMLGPARLRVAPAEADVPSQTAAREAFARGEYAQALELMPHGARNERRVLEALLRGADARGAVLAVGEAQRSFYFTSLQSAVFNAVLDARLRAGTLDALQEGDLAFKHDNGAVFDVDAEAIQRGDLPSRLSTLAISPSGPMWGARMKRARGETDEAEVAALRAFGLEVSDLESFARQDPDAFGGDRRPLRVPLSYPDVEAGSDEHGLYVRCSFELPPGAFATTVMQELTKPDRAPPPAKDRATLEAAPSEQLADAVRAALQGGGRPRRPGELPTDIPGLGQGAS